VGAGDGGGCVSGWERRDKAPGERIVAEDRGNRIFYNIEKSIEKAKKEGWDAYPYGGTTGERAARAVERDFKRIRGLFKGDWCYITIGLEVTDAATEGEVVDETDWLGGVESDSEQEVLCEIVEDMAKNFLCKYGTGERMEKETWKRKQEQALVESIEHWKENCKLHALGDDMDVSTAGCACCRLVGLPDGQWMTCLGCPIFEYTGQPLCYGTPYNSVVVLHKNPSLMVEWLQELAIGGTPAIIIEEEE
jgi:hypothetical protein